MWPPFASCSAAHLLRIELIWLLIVACGMLVHTSLMAVRSWWISAGTGIRCRIRRPSSIPNMLNGWHVRWVWWSCKNWDVFSFQELCTDPCNMGPCIIMLQHEVMVYNFVQYRYTTRFINRQEISVYSTMKAYYRTNLTVSAICFIINCAHLLYAQNSQNVPHLKHKLNIIKDRKWHNNVSVSIHSRLNCHLLHSV